jgi:hypothetical protein
MVKDVEVEIVPARTTEYTSDYFNEHTITHHPEHEVHKVRTMCGQPRKIHTGGLAWFRGGRYKRYDTMTDKEVTRKVNLPQYWPSEDIRPQPLCSRCAKKADEYEAQS